MQQRLRHTGLPWSTTGQSLEKRCQVCQYQGKFIRVPPEPLNATNHSCSFAFWGIDKVGTFEATARKYKYILVATSYLSKWAKVIAVKEFTTMILVEFIESTLSTDLVSQNSLWSIMPNLSRVRLCINYIQVANKRDQSWRTMRQLMDLQRRSINPHSLLYSRRWWAGIKRPTLKTSRGFVGL